MKKAKFLMSHFDAGAERFKAGEVHDLTDETRLCIARGAAVEIDVSDEPVAETPAAEDETNAADVDAKPAEAETPAADTKPAGKAKK